MSHQGSRRQGSLPQRIARAAGSAIAGRIGAGSEVYQRSRHLPRIIPVGPDEMADDSMEGRAAILRKLARALRAERTRGRAGHWTYDLNRHIALSQAYVAERRAARDSSNAGAKGKGATPVGVAP
jgi:hypothetical protein